MLLPRRPVEVELGSERLHIQKEIRCDGSVGPGLPDLIVFNPDLNPTQINYSLRIKPGQSLHISHDEPNQEHLFRKPREAFRRNFYLDYEGENLVFRDPISELGTFITLLEEDIEQSPIVARRQQAIDKIIALYGGPLKTMSRHQALDTLQQVNSLLKNDAFRPKDANGTAGGLLRLPAHVTPVVIGDLHANIDNLLKILSENAFIWALEKKSAVLVFLGDLVQPDSEPYDEMDSSVLMMDFLFKLKLHFPDGIFFLRGNHDSFAVEASKDLVPQGVLWRKRLEQLRGTEYCEKMAHFYDLSPVIALSENFVACHAGPPFNRIDMSQVVNIRSFPDVLHDLMWNRVRRRGYPSGYTASDVRRFRKSLNLAKELPFLVGHTPYSDTGTVWCDVAGIRHHHILYSAKKGESAIFIRVNGQMVPQLYAAEPLLEWVNKRAEKNSPGSKAIRS
ncbi:MAG: metallophosphoesterase [Arenicellales bacterium]|nr:metallophosphoesterase [Arenicellales bacterium]